MSENVKTSRDDARSARRTRSSEPSPTSLVSGLGRGLAGILDDTLSVRASAGVDELVGRRPHRSPAGSVALRRRVTSLALDALADLVGDAEVDAAVDREHAAALAGLARSVGSALAEPRPLPTDHALRVLVREEHDGVLADVRLALGAERRHAAAVADSPVRAVAQAAAELCDESMRVSFAGTAPVDGRFVTVVIVVDASGQPLFGLSTHDDDAERAAAEAVFTAAAVAGIDPFGGIGEGA